MLGTGSPPPPKCPITAGNEILELLPPPSLLQRAVAGLSRLAGEEMEPEMRRRKGRNR